MEVPFCPNPSCAQHFRSTESPMGKWYQAAGWYSTKSFGHVRRFRCRVCGRWFSQQSFSIDYRAHKKVDYRELLTRHASSASGRAICRAMALSQGTVQNRIDRLARQALALHTRLAPLARKDERVCVDGFVSFDRSQYFPSEITLSIASESRFILEMSQTNRRRSGTMTPRQRERAKLLYAQAKLEKGGVKRTFREILDSLERERKLAPELPLILTTDEKPEYAEVLRRHPLFRAQDAAHRVVHQTVNSKLPRTYANPLFASNYLDREIRKDQANHHRESTCFSRNVANSLSRLTCYLFHHNYLKKYLIKAPLGDQRTHAEAAGISPALTAELVRKAFSLRAFLSRESLSPPGEKIWRKASPTPLKTTPEYLPAYAYA